MTRRSPTHALLAAALSGALLDVAIPALASAAEPDASPEARDPAREQFRAGVHHYREGDLQGAILAFTRAYDLSADYRLLFNLAQVHEDAKEYAEALHSLELYLSKGGEAIDPDRRDEVQRTRARLERLSAAVRVTTNVRAAELWIDGVAAGRLPSATLWLNPGVHRLLVARRGQPPVQQELVILPGERQLIEVSLPVTAPAAATASGAPPRAPAARTPLWIGLGATGASTALGIGFALLTRGADHRLERELSRFPADDDALDAARSRVTTFATATDLCIGFAAVAAGVSLYFALSSGSDDEPSLGELAFDAAPGSSSLAFRRRF
ncbi:MAG TPA: hypothetical protein VMG12_41050 [Polyangiaceae bacterium]|nr:hypothetical protein [Polyangiaceae bacterium]